MKAKKIVEKLAAFSMAAAMLLSTSIPACSTAFSAIPVAAAPTINDLDDIPLTNDDISAKECHHVRTEKVTVGKACYFNEEYHYTAGWGTKCSDCGELLNAVSGVPERHRFTWSVAKKASCLADGYEEHGCGTCGYVVKKTTEKATKDISSCKVLFQNQTVIVKDEMANKNIPDSCFDIRYNRETDSFTITGKNGFTGTLTVTCPHTKTITKTTGKAGYDNKYHWTAGSENICEACGVTVSAIDGAIAAHNLKVVKYVAPTCTKNGYQIKSCSCGYTTKVTIAATHNLSGCKAVLTKNNTVQISDGSTVISSTYYNISKKDGIATIIGKNGYRGTLKCKIAITPAFTHYQKGTKTVSVYWDAPKQSGYQLAYKTKAMKDYKISNTKETHDKVCTDGRAVNLKVRAYQIVNGQKIFSSWSAVKSIQ